MLQVTDNRWVFRRQKVTSVVGRLTKEWVPCIEVLYKVCSRNDIPFTICMKIKRNIYKILKKAREGIQGSLHVSHVKIKRIIYHKK